MLALMLKSDWLGGPHKRRDYLGFISSSNVEPSLKEITFLLYNLVFFGDLRIIFSI